MAENDVNTTNNGGSQIKVFIIFFVISLLITAVIGVLIYRYFNRQSLFNFNFSNNTEKPTEQLATVETGEPDQAASDSTIDPTPTPSPTLIQPDFNGFGNVEPTRPVVTPNVTTTPRPTTSPRPTFSPTPSPSVTPTTSTPTQKPAIAQNQGGSWKANDYKPGDIKGDTHLVIVGDTLWEISEGKYGEGRVWRKIADANQVRYLWNGNPLIVPGSTLSLPK